MHLSFYVSEQTEQTRNPVPPDRAWRALVIRDIPYASLESFLLSVNACLQVPFKRSKKNFSSRFEILQPSSSLLCE